MTIARASVIPLEHFAAEATRRPAQAEAQDARDQAELIHATEPVGDVLAYLKRFVAYPSEHAALAHALWVIHAHAMNAWESTPRIAFLSPEPGSGKSRALEASELLVPRPVNAVNVSVAYLFRRVGAEEGRPTILYDEVDTVFTKAGENEDIRGLLNAGHRRHAVVGRCVVEGKTVRTEETPAFCAVALAGLGDLPDTLLTRSVVVRMRRRAPHERVEPYRRRDVEPAADALRERIEAWTALRFGDLEAARPVFPPGVEDRDADVWEALLAVADAAGGDWPARARAAAVAMVTEAKAVPVTLGVRLLADLRAVFDRVGVDRLATEAILTALHALDESPWGDLRGKPLDARGLSARLRPYGVGPKPLRDGGGVFKGYERADLEDPWGRYLPPLSLTPCATVTSPPLISEGASAVTGVTDVTGYGGERETASATADDDDEEEEGDL